MEKFNPKVSVIIPVYNGSNYLKEAIDSALAQTYKNIEIIVVNDGSTDNGATEKVAKSYGDRIKYFGKKNGGVATALNLGIEKMTGEYFSWLSHDDIYKPFKVERQIAYLSGMKNKNVVLYSDYELIDEQGRLIEKRIQDHKMLERAPINSLLRGILNGITILVPKAAFNKHGNFDPSLWCTQDYDLWYRLFSHYPFIHQPEILSRTRVHAKQDTVSNPKVVTEGNVLWKRMIKDLPDKVKIQSEGSLFNFYFELAKFIKYTPYDEVVEYCRQQLEGVAQSEETGLQFYDDTKKTIETYESLVAEGQTRAAAYLLENVIKRMVDKRRAKDAAYILSEKLVGKNTGLDEDSIQRLYVPKIANKSKKARVMFCSGHWLTGGMERVMSILFGQLKDEYELFLLTPADGRQGKIEVPDYVTHLKMSNEFFYDSYGQISLSFALAFDIDVAIGFMNLFNGQLDFYELCAGTRVKTVASNHEIYFYPYRDPYYYGLICRRLDVFKRLDAALWLTNFSAAAYGLASDNSYLLPNPNTYKVQTAAYDGKEKIILCVGRFNDYIKRVDRMLRCFSIVSKSQPDAKLVLVGKCNRDLPIRPGYEDTINDLLRKLKIDEDKVVFVGEVGNVEEYYSRASVLLLTSDSEGFGMVINEAACFGVPAVCNKIPGLEDLITDGENGFLTDQDDVDAMAGAVNKILSDQKLRSRLSSNAKKMVARFDEAEIGKKWKYLLNTLLDDRPDKKLKLSKVLSYEVSDYKELSRLLFDELSKMVSVNLDERNELLKPRLEGTLSFISRKTKHNYRRLHKVVTTKGLLRTSAIIAEKAYRKARRLYKRP